MTCRMLALIYFFSVCLPANAEELAGKWADNPKSCKGDRTGSGVDGTDYQVMDFSKRMVSYFDADVCPMLEFVSKANAQAATSHVYKVYCKSEGGDGPSLWLSTTRESDVLKIVRVNLQSNEAPFHYSLHRCL